MKLFNINRFKSIKTKRLQNYLVYAIGEIILVVVGILVAVSINNRNEAKKDEAQVDKIAAQVKQRIETDIKEIKRIKQILDEDLKLYNLFLKKDKTPKETKYVSQQAPYLVTMVVEFASFNSIVSSSLDKATLSNSVLSNKLLEIDQDYKSIYETLKPTEDLIKDELISNINHIKKNFYWYEKLMNDQALTEEEFSYFESVD